MTYIGKGVCVNGELAEIYQEEDGTYTASIQKVRKRYHHDAVQIPNTSKSYNPYHLPICMKDFANQITIRKSEYHPYYEYQVLPNYDKNGKFICKFSYNGNEIVGYGTNEKTALRRCQAIIHGIQRRYNQQNIVKASMSPQNIIEESENIIKSPIYFLNDKKKK